MPEKEGEGSPTPPEARPSGLSVDQLVEARIDPLRQEMRALSDRVVTLLAENQVLQKDNQSLKDGLRRVKRGTGGIAPRRGLEFEGDTEEERDANRVDWIRNRLEKMERKGRGLSRLEQRRFLLTIESIEEEELKERIYSEMALRQEWAALLFQWEEVSGSDKDITELLIRRPRKLKIDQLVEMSNLAEANDGEGRERVSLSVQISRAMNLYFNYLGIWAEAFDDEQARKIAHQVRTDPRYGRSSEGEVNKEIDKRVREHSLQAATMAERRLSELSVTNEGRIRFVEQINGKCGVRASNLREIIGKFPKKELEDYRTGFLNEVGQANNDRIFSLDEIFGKCMFTEAVTAQDILWTRSVVAGLSGSISAEVQALSMLDFTGETDVLNVIWKDGAYRATDYQKFLRLEERRKREASKGHPYGYDANLGKFENCRGEKTSGQGWFENAQIDALAVYGIQLKGKNGNLQELPLSIREILRGGEIWYDKEGEPVWRSLDLAIKGEWPKGKSGRNLVQRCEPMPFHKIDWNILGRDTYTVDFLLTNFRYGKVFSDCSRELKLEEFSSLDSLRSMNKALKVSFGRKSEFVENFGTERNREHGVPEWVVHSPWVWYAIGFLSAHNPENKQIGGMKAKPPANELFVYGLSDEEKRVRAKKPTYEENFYQPLLSSGFLTKEEIDFVEKYCQVSQKHWGVRG